MSITPRTILSFAKSLLEVNEREPSVRAENAQCEARSELDCSIGLCSALVRLPLSFSFFRGLVPPPSRRWPYILGRLNSVPLLVDLIVVSERRRCPPPMHGSFPDPYVESGASGMRRVPFLGDPYRHQLNIADTIRLLAFSVATGEISPYLSQKRMTDPIKDL